MREIAKKMSVLNTKVSLNRDSGLLEVYDTQTGKLVAIQETPDQLLDNNRRERLVERLMPDGSRVLVEATIDPVKLLGFKFTEYSGYVVDLICEKIVAGGSLTAICKEPGFPTYAEFCRWKRNNPEIQKAIDEARRDRAEFIRDKIYATADKLSDNITDDVKIKLDNLKYLAGTDDRQKYGNQKSEATVVQPIQIVVNTGIVREGEK